MKDIEKLICLGYAVMTGTFILYNLENNYRLSKDEVTNKPSMEYLEKQSVPKNYSSRESYK